MFVSHKLCTAFHVIIKYLTSVTPYPGNQLYYANINMTDTTSSDQYYYKRTHGVLVTSDIGVSTSVTSLGSS